MRRLIAVVALLVMTWPHIAVMRCHGPLPSPASDASSMVSEHGHGTAECPALMVCSAAMIESVADVAVTEPPTPTVRLFGPPPPASGTAVPTAEPPPPRRSA